jgi:hypothetical protein
MSSLSTPVRKRHSTHEKSGFPGVQRYREVLVPTKEAMIVDVTGVSVRSFIRILRRLSRVFPPASDPTPAIREGPKLCCMNEHGLGRRSRDGRKGENATNRYNSFKLQGLLGFEGLGYSARFLPYISRNNKRELGVIFAFTFF